MPETIVVAGTDTNAGKTVFSAMLAAALDACYWKPVQSGAEEGTDTERVGRLSGLPAERLLPERYVFNRPLSPHRAAELEDASIDPARLAPLPQVDRALVVETAGGLLVPLTRSLLQIDLIKLWQAPVALCARTSLGTINHTLLSLEALKSRGIPVLGVAFIGDPNEDSERTILGFSGARGLGRLPWLPQLSPAALKEAFERGFKREDFRPRTPVASRMPASL